MILDYFRIALRNLWRYKTYAFINISGLAVGIACFLLISLFVRHELSYDRFHENADRIYRVTQRENRTGRIVTRPAVFQSVGPGLLREFPEVENAVRFDRSLNISVKRGDRTFLETGFFYTDSTVFDVFSFPLIAGSPKQALAEPNSIVITEAMAEKYFGDEDPIGGILIVDGQREFRVTGVVKNIPQHSHLKFKFLASVSPAELDPSRWRGFCYTYILLSEDASPGALEAKLPEFIVKNRGEAARDILQFHLQPLTDIHLHSNMEFELEPNGDIRVVYVFTSIAVFILFIACINYMNLSTARYTHRATEVGMRKIVGAHRGQLVRQFLFESFMMTLFAFPVALLLSTEFLPTFNALAGRVLTFDVWRDWRISLQLFALLCFVSLVSGSYPAYCMSAFQPVRLFKGDVRIGMTGLRLRRILVLFQFVISIILIVCTLVGHRQLMYIRNKQLGFDKENTVVISTLKAGEVKERYDAFKQALLRYPNVIGVTGSNAVPGQTITIDMFKPEGAGDEDRLILNSLLVDYDFIRTLGLEIVDGRDFSREYLTDANAAFILNESAVERIGWKSAVDKEFEYVHFRKGSVIGVVRDFHFRSLHQHIEPVVMCVMPSNAFIYEITVKIKPMDVPGTLAFIKQTWNVFSNRPMDYFFLDENFDLLHRPDEKLTGVFRIFAGLAIFITCLGLFGLVSFTAEQRTKEIGIRKVLGATVSNVVFLLSKAFMKWVVLANVIAWPVAYILMSRWLQDFAHRTRLSVWIFVLSAVLTSAIALLTIGYQTILAAVKNPVHTLKHE